MITNLEKLIGYFSEDRSDNKVKIVSFDVFDTRLIER